MKKLVSNPWTGGVVLLVLYLLALFLLVGSMAKLVATIIAVVLGLCLVQLENRSTRSFIIGVSVAIIVLAVFVIYIKMARFFSGSS